MINYGLSVQTQGARLQGVARILEAVLEHDTPQVQSRALRGLGHLGFVSKKAQSFAREHIVDASALRYFELCPDKSATSAILEAELPKSVRLAALRCLVAQTVTSPVPPRLEALIRSSLTSELIEERIEALRLLARVPSKAFLGEVLRFLDESDSRVCLAAVIALKGFAPYVDDTAVERLAPLLRSEQQSIAGRALDTMTAFPGIRAKRVLIDFLRERADDADVCDKIIRCLDSPETGTDYFVAVIDDILKRHPQHPQLDGLISLREKMAENGTHARANAAAIKGADIAAIDRSLTSRIANYEKLDESVRSALRSAELPYQHPQMFDEYVDKSSSLVEYCKAVDIELEKTLGKRHLFPKIENQLHEFQSALHVAALNEDFPSADRVIRQMGLEKHFNSQSLPLHKMLTVAQSIRNGRIVNERFKTLDGLRAWAVMLLVFGRKIQGGKALIPVKDATDDQIATFCKRLIALQEIRNPAAHRQTVSELAVLDETRNEALSLLNQIQRLF